MVIGILFVSNVDAKILIDPGVIHSFVTNSYAMHLGRESRRVDIPTIVSTLVGETLRTDVVCPSCMVMVQKHELSTDLFPLKMCDFVVILGRLVV